MKKLLITLFCASLGLSMMAGGQPLSPDRFRQAMAKAELSGCPATPGARATAPSLLKSRQGVRFAPGVDSYDFNPIDLSNIELYRLNYDLSQSIGSWILDTEQYEVVSNDDGSYAVSDDCSYARGRALPLYLGDEENTVVVGNFITTRSILNTTVEYDLPLTIYDDNTVGIPHIVYYGIETIPTISIHYKTKSTTIYAIPEEWLNDDFEDGPDEILGNLFDDGTIYFENGFMFLTMEVVTSFEFAGDNSNTRDNRGMIVTDCDTSYVCNPVMRNLFLLPSNAIHQSVMHKWTATTVLPDEPADSTSTGGDGSTVVPGGLGGFGGYVGSIGLTSEPMSHVMLSFHFGNEHSTCGYSGPVNRPPISGGGGKPINPPGNSGTVRPHGGGPLPGVETLTAESLILDNKLRNRLIPLDTEDNDTLLAPTFVCWIDDTTMAVYNLYDCGQMVEMYIRPDGTMSLPMQYIGIYTQIGKTILLKGYDVYNYSATDSTLIDMTPGNTGEMLDDWTICWDITVLFNENYLSGYYYDRNMLFLFDDYLMNRSVEKTPSITDITRDINALLHGDSSRTITGVSNKNNGLLNASSQ